MDDHHENVIPGSTAGAYANRIRIQQEVVTAVMKSHDTKVGAISITCTRCSLRDRELADTPCEPPTWWWTVNGFKRT